MPEDPAAMTKKIAIESTAEAYLELLASRGVEYLFANAGTDFAPLIEAWAKRLAQGADDLDLIELWPGKVRVQYARREARQAE